MKGSNSNPTTKLKVDISDLKKNITEANRKIRLINAQFKESTAGLDKWSDSADGLSAKIKQVTGRIEQEKIKLETLEEQHRLVAEAEGEDSKGAEELLIKITNQRAAVNKAEASLKKYTQKLKEFKEEQKANEEETKAQKTRLEQLNESIAEQERTLRRLKEEYQNATLEFGKNSDKAKKLASEIGNLSTEIEKDKRIVENLNDAADSLDKTLEDVDKAAMKSGDGFTTMKGAMAKLIADGIEKMAKTAADALKKIATDSETAYNSFQAKTGAASKSMQEYKKQIDDLYKSGFGDDMNDVADAMAEVKQQTKEMDPTKLKDMTENAITMRDTFEYDIQEQLRAVKMLMDQFGISSTEAFNLLIQGTQKGLNKNGDLLDTINEYGVHYKQLGYSAEEFFNSLESGSEAGTFSIDKLGDATKEFGIRTKDTASTTKEGFELLGYSASASAEEIEKTKDKIAQLEKNLKYAKMEQEGFNSKTSKLTRLKNSDKIKEYSEELKKAKKQLKESTKEGKKAGKSIESLQARFAEGGETARKATKEVLKKLMSMDDKVKQNQAGVDLFGTMWEDLGIEGVKALMKTNGTMDKTKQSMKEIKKIKYDDIANEYKKVGRTLEQDLFVPIAQKALPAVKDFAEFAIKHMSELEAGIKTVGITLGVAFAVKKITDFTNSITTMVTTFMSLRKATEGAVVAQESLNVAQAANPIGLVVAGVAGLVGVLGTLAVKTALAQNEIDGFTEAERKNIDALEDMAQSYKEKTDARNKALANTEGEFSYYKDLKEELDNLVDKNNKVKKGYEDRAKFIAETLNEKLGTELEITGKIVKNYQNEKKALDDLLKTQKAKIILENSQADYEGAYASQKEDLSELTTAQENYKKAVEDARKKEKEYQELKNKSPKEIEEYAKKSGMVNNMTAAYEQHNKKLLEAKDALDLAKGKQEELNEKLTKAQKAYSGNASLIKNYEKLSAAVFSGSVKKMNNAMLDLEYNFIRAEDGSEEMLEEQVKKTKEYYESQKKAVQNGTPGVEKETLKSAKRMVKKAEEELKKAQSGTKEAGTKASDAFRKGLEIGKNPAGKSAKKLGKEVKKELKKIKTEEEGENFVQGFIDGLKSNKKNASLLNAAKKIATNAWNSLKKNLEIHSPSRKTKKLGIFFTEGFAIGIVDAAKSVEKGIDVLAKRSLKRLKEANKKGNYEKAGAAVVSSFEKGIAKKEKAAERAVKSLVNKTVAEAKKETKSSKVKKSFSDLGSKLIESFSDSFSKAADKATKKVQQKIEKLTATAQEKYDAIKDLQEDLEKRLSEGELFSEDDSGNILLTDFQSETTKIIRFGKNMETLKSKLSEELMAEIAELSTEDGTKLTDKLLSLSDGELAAYNKAYTAKLNASKKVASKYYSEKINLIKNDYSKKLTKVMSELEKQLNKIGENAMKGFIKGLSSKDKEMEKSVKKIKDNLLKSIKKELDIHSPSRVMEREVGMYIAPGIAKGIIKKTSVIKDAMQQVSEQITKPIKTSIMSARLDSGAYSRGAFKESQPTISNTNNFYQTNNSPRALSRWDIYRQSKNMFEGAMNHV